MFVRYLKSYFAGYTLPEKDKETRQQLRDPRYTCLEFVRVAAEQKSSSPLGRTLNAFPFEHEGHLPVSDDVSAPWVQQFDTAMKAISFQEAKGEITVVVNAEAEEQIKAWIGEVITQACDEMLDDDGKLKQEIIDTMGLRVVIDAWQGSSARSDDIELQIMYSYCVQLLLGRTATQWETTLRASFLDNGGNPLLAGLLTRYIEKLFADSKTNEWTPFFLKKVKEFSDGKSVLNACIAKLKRTPNDELNTAIKNMTQEEKSDASIPDVGSASPALWVKHVELWIDIMHHFKAQNDMVHVRSIYQMLSSKVVDVLEYEFLYRPDEKATDKVERYQISVGALEKYAECNRLLNPEPVEARQGALPDVNLSTMSTILNTFSSFLYLLLRPRSLFQYFGLYRQPTTTCAAEVKNEVAASVVKRPGVTVL